MKVFISFESASALGTNFFARNFSLESKYKPSKFLDGRHITSITSSSRKLFLLSLLTDPHPRLLLSRLVLESRVLTAHQVTLTFLPMTTLLPLFCPLMTVSEALTFRPTKPPFSLSSNGSLKRYESSTLLMTSLTDE